MWFAGYFYARWRWWSRRGGRPGSTTRFTNYPLSLLSVNSSMLIARGSFLELMVIQDFSTLALAIIEESEWDSGVCFNKRNGAGCSSPSRCSDEKVVGVVTHNIISEFGNIISALPKLLFVGTKPFLTRPKLVLKQQIHFVFY